MWWAWGLRGLIAIIFGIAALVVPGLTLSFLAIIFGAFLAADGLLAIIAAATRRQGQPWGMLLIEGVLGLAIGILMFLFPGSAILAFVYLTSAWALLTGILEIAAAFSLRREITGEWSLAVAGILSIVFSGILVFAPITGVFVLSWIMGAYAILFGIMMVSVAFTLHRRLRPGGRPETLPLSRRQQLPT